MKEFLETSSSRSNGDKNGSMFRDNVRSACGRDIIIYVIVRKWTR